LRKAIISKCNKEVVHGISECILNVLNWQYKADKLRHARTTKTQGVASQDIRKARATLRQKETYSTKRGIPAASIECHPTYAR